MSKDTHCLRFAVNFKPHMLALQLKVKPVDFYFSRAISYLDYGISFLSWLEVP